MAKFKAPSAAVWAGRKRRVSSADRRDVRIEWFIKNVSSKVNLTMKVRVKLATEFVKDKVVRNISQPVTKGSAGRGAGGRFTKAKVAGRSKPGEFPRADTTQLMKTIFGEVKTIRPGMYDGFVGTPLDYGLILETNARLDRGFLKKTFEENRALVIRMLSGPIS